MTSDMQPLDRHHPRAGHILTGLLVAPSAWLVQMFVAETLAAQSCYPFNHPLAAPVVSWLRPALIVTGALCFVVGASGSLVAWRNLRKIGPKQWGGLSGEPRTRAELEWFLSRVAMMCSTLFLFALIATDIALAVVSPCRWW